MSFQQVAWFVLVGVLLTGYAVLDGFDLGVGIWYAFARKKHRAILLKAIAPTWDGNEVWLLTAGGALFAAFPHVYATIFSGFYLALILVLFALIFRAVAIEFRNKEESPAWQQGWDVAFVAGSALPALLFGVALGNILNGVPLDAHMTFTGDFFTLLNPYALLIGVVGLAMIATHGAIYIAQRTEGELRQNASRWAGNAGSVYVILLLAAAIVTVLTQPRLLENYAVVPVFWALPALSIAAALAVVVMVKRGNYRSAFIASTVAIGANMGMCGAGLFPNLVPALGDPNLSLTITNSSSSPLTLTAMLVVAAIGVPVMLAYTAWVYGSFSGKVRADSAGY